MGDGDVGFLQPSGEHAALPNYCKKVSDKNFMPTSRLPALAEAGWDVWERLAALEPADGKRDGGHVAGQLEPGLAGMTAVVEQRQRLQVGHPAVGMDHDQSCP